MKKTNTKSILSLEKMNIATLTNMNMIVGGKPTKKPVPLPYTLTTGTTPDSTKTKPIGPSDL